MPRAGPSGNRRLYRREPRQEWPPCRVVQSRVERCRGSRREEVACRASRGFRESETVSSSTGGDGDQRFFSNRILLWLREAEELPRKIGGFYGDALYFVVEGGPYAGTPVALTPRMTGTLEDQITRGGWASVIGHLVKVQIESFTGQMNEVDSIGMSFVERL